MKNQRMFVFLFGLTAVLISTTTAATPMDAYRWSLSEEHMATHGTIPYDAEIGDKVVAVPAKKHATEHGGHGHEASTKVEYMKIVVHSKRPSMLRSTDRVHFDISMPTAASLTSKQTHDIGTEEPQRPSTMDESSVEPTETTELHRMSTSDLLRTNRLTPAQQEHHSSHHNVHVITSHHHTGSPLHSTVVRRSLRRALAKRNAGSAENVLNSVSNTDRSHKDSHVIVKRNVFVDESHRKEPMEFLIVGTKSIMIDTNYNYLKINDTAELKDQETLEFYIVLINHNGEYISNPLPFEIEIERPEVSSDYPVLPAAFAGVLCLFVILLAIIIPVVTRAKRRHKQGKPLFKLGSHPSSVDLQNTAYDKRGMSRDSSEPNWYGNNVFYNYEDEMEHGRSDFAAGIRQYSTKTMPPTLQLTKKVKAPPSDVSSSSGVDVASQGGAEGTRSDDAMSERM